MKKDFIEDFIESRLEGLIGELKFLDEYQIAKEKEIVLSKELMELLQEKDLFFEYEDCKSEVEYYELEKAYTMGFKDCFNLILKLYQSEELISKS